MLGATNYAIEIKVAGGNYGSLGDSAVSYSQSYCGYNYPTVDCPSLTTDTTTYKSIGLTANTTYCYQVKSWNESGGNPSYSIEKCDTTLPIAELTLVATPLNSFKIRLDWTRNVCTENACIEPDGYEVERLVRDGNWVKIATVTGADVTTYTDRTAIDPIKQYRYRVRAYSGSLKSQNFAEAVTYTPPYAPGHNVNP